MTENVWNSKINLGSFIVLIRRHYTFGVSANISILLFYKKGKGGRVVFGFLKKSKDVTNDISNVSENTGRQTAAVFVDYEHWFYAYNNIYNLKPNVSEWYDEIKDQYDVKSIKFFGDFSENNIKKELPKLEKITDGIVHTASMKDGVDKDFTDVIILDQIYRYASKKKSPDVYILFTGDAHFLKVAEYLNKNLQNTTILGPSIANVFRVNNVYRFQIILKYKKEDSLYKVLKQLLEHYKTNQKIKIDIDFNPIHI